MKRLPMTVSVGLLVAAMATPSFAADLPRPSYKAPLYSAPAFSWTGFYAGLNVGYGFGTSDWTGVGTIGSTSPKGVLAGLTLGYNLQTGYWVWGLEGDIDYSGMKGSTVGTGACGGIGCETKNSWLGTARGRIGYAGWDRWLPYITGGAAFGDVKRTSAAALTESETKFGWTAGAGIEYAVLTNWSAKLEYLYADLGKSTCSAATCGTDTEVTFKSSMVRLGLNYRF
ncbi:MAG TPA: outer membrane protein [Pseudolabrys sp.]|nr:outer membrane protein [Pseudolabrys sp.]